MEAHKALAAPGQPDGMSGPEPATTGSMPAPVRETPKIADAPASESAPDPRTDRCAIMFQTRLR